MKNLIRVISLFLFSALLTTSCSYDEGIDLMKLKVQLEYEQTSFAGLADAKVRVELRDMSGQVYADSTDATRTATFLVPPGIYEATTASQYIDSVSSSTWWRYMFNGTQSLIIVSPDSLNEVLMSVRVSRKRIVH